MKFLNNLFGSKSLPTSSGELLKRATQLKKSGDWDGAIDCLRKAYSNAKVEKIGYATDVYLRLPKYLFESGDADKAWAEYNRALSEGVSGRLPSKEMLYVEQSQIYEAMAHQQKKENNFYDSAILQALSALSWEKGMLAQGRKSELDIAFLSHSLGQLLKKSGDDELVDDFLSVTNTAISDPKNNECGSLSRELKALKAGRG